MRTSTVPQKIPASVHDWLTTSPHDDDSYEIICSHSSWLPMVAVSKGVSHA